MANETPLDLVPFNGNLGFVNVGPFTPTPQSNHLAVVQSPLPPGWGSNYVVQCDQLPGANWPSNNTGTVLFGNTSGENANQTYYYVTAVYIPSGAADFDVDTELVWELHHGSSLYNLSAGAAVAPFAVFYHDPNEFRARINCGDAAASGNVNGGYTHQEFNIQLWPNPPRDTWLYFGFAAFFTETNTGWVKYWKGTDPSFWTENNPDISRTALPTLDFCSNPPIHNQPYYWQGGLYMGYTNTSTRDRVYHAGTYRRTSFAAMVQAATGGAVVLTPTSNLVNNQECWGPTNWIVNTNVAMARVDYFANGVQVGSIAGTTNFPFTLDTNQLPYGTNTVGYRIYDNSNALTYNTSFSITVKRPSGVVYNTVRL